MRPLRAGLLLVALAAAPAGAADFVAAEMVGPETCKACHAEAYNAWKLSKHSRALDSLSPQQQKDGRCLSCHSPNNKDENVAGVTCETCHGGGQYYAASYVMKDPELARMVGLVDPSEKSCRSCHDASSPSLRPFDFVEKLKLIDHWTAARQKRAEAGRTAPEPSRAESKKK